MRLRASGTVALAGAGLVLALAGCGGGGDADPSASAWAFGPALQSLEQQAEAAGASDAQILVLKRWEVAHDTPYSDVAAAAQRLFDCFDAAGLKYSYSAPAGGEDYPEFHYLVNDDPAVDDDAEMELMNHCEDLEINFVSTAYQTGPGVTSRRARDDAAYFPQAVQCLETKGVLVDSDIATLDELDAYLDDSGQTEYAGCTAPPYTNVG